MDKLPLRAGYDGWPLIHGHRVTKEMCAALQADPPEQAADFFCNDLVALANEMGPPDFSSFAEPLTVGGGYSGIQLDHEDGSTFRSAGLECPGVALLRAGWTDCRSHGLCTHCDGSPVRWECGRREG